MNSMLELPYITEDLPGIGGRLRAIAEDFLVEELPLYKPEGKGQHLYINLTKEGLTTREVQEKLANLLNLPATDIGYAGLKDKYARTTQTFSLLVGNVSDEFTNQAVELIKNNLPVTVHWARLHKNKLRPGHLLGNRFTIKITGLELQSGEALCQAREIVTRLQQRGLPNFFGPQRFGFKGDNIQRGLEIVQGRLHNVDRWLRRYLISSYQSYLCNRYLALRLERGVFDNILLGDIAKKYATGGMFEVVNRDEEQPRYEKHEISFTAPIYGSNMWTAKGVPAALESEILDEAGISLRQFEAAKVEGTRRLGRLLVPDLSVDPCPQGLAVSFTLPKGAFATTVLREIMKNEIPTVSL